jgi:Domain of unknown function (DUF4845)
MRDRQYGLALSGLVVWLVILVVLVLIGMKVGPAYLEYYAAKKAINEVAQNDQNGTVADMRKHFDLKAAIDNMAINGGDLEISRAGGVTVISFAYRKDIPLFDNIGLYINFEASTQ